MQAPPQCDLFWGSIWKMIPEFDRLSELDVKEVFGQKIIQTDLIQENSTVTFSPKADITIGCPIDLAPFPFDKQECKLEMQIQKGIAFRTIRSSLRNSSRDTLGYLFKVKR